VKRALLLDFLLLGGLAAAVPAPSSKSNTPDVQVTFPNTQLRATADSVCAVDFRNIRLARNKGWAVQLKGGKYDHRETISFESVRLGGVHCFDVQDGVPRYAVVNSTWSYGGGSSNNECVVQVITLQSGHLTVVQQFDFDCHALSTGATFDNKSHKLTLRARTEDDSPLCCAKTLDVVSYVWHEDRFKQSNFRRTPAIVVKGADGVEHH